MLESTIDARGLACPQPVLLAKKALEQAGSATLLVDNSVAVENLRRLAGSLGCAFSVQQAQEAFLVSMARGQDAPVPPASAPESEPILESRATGQPVLLVAGESIGQGSEELGLLLMRAFFHTLGEADGHPSAAIFMNGGVKLAVEGSPVLEDLHLLASKGVEILACGTCLNHFGLMDRLAVGRVSNMYEISETLFRAPRILRL